MFMNGSLNAYCISAKTAQTNVAKTLEGKYYSSITARQCRTLGAESCETKHVNECFVCRQLGSCLKGFTIFFYQFLALFLHRKLGQNRHQLIAWTFILKHS